LPLHRMTRLSILLNPWGYIRELEAEYAAAVGELDDLRSHYFRVEMELARIYSQRSEATRKGNRTRRRKYLDTMNDIRRELDGAGAR
jgi:hypothetical protein